MFKNIKQWLLAGLIIFLVILQGNGAKNNTQNTHLASQKINQPTDNQTGKVISSVIQHKIVTTTQLIPFSSTQTNDPTAPSGTTKIVTQGINGIETKTWDVTYTDGIETNRVVIDDKVTAPPVNQIVMRGTYIPPKPSCDPNYSGACVPNVYPSDVDCAGGSGDGPYYVAGPVYVIGADRYGLDRDGDGIACEG